jgi:NAD(P)-dependent dehydrogenase (short-subunit alcohol dehydrogenase family)
VEAGGLATQRELRRPVNQDIFSLIGHTALITGAAKGLGRVLAVGLARQGADVVAIDLDPSVGSLAAEIESFGRKAITATCDITREDEVRDLVDRCVREFGPIDILVNNAGINLKAPAIEQTRANFQPVIDVNLIGTFLCCQAVARAMLQRRRGSIINIASIAGLAGLGRGNNFYCATKGAIIALTRDLALEWAAQGVRVNALAPGWFATDRVTSYLQTQPGLRSRMESAVPLGHLGNPAELIGPVVFLAAEASSMVTGQVLVVDGGLLSAVPLPSA